MSDDIDIDNLMTQTQLAKHLDVSATRINNWIARRRSTGFPDHVVAVGKYKFYEVDKVTRWYKLWSKATATLGNTNLNKKG